MGACRRVPSAPLGPCLFTGGWGGKAAVGTADICHAQTTCTSANNSTFPHPRSLPDLQADFSPLRLFITDAISPAPLPQFHYLFLPRRPVSFLPSQSFSLRLLQLLPLLFPAPHPSPLLTGEPFPAGCPQSTPAALPSAALLSQQRAPYPLKTASFGLNKYDNFQGFKDIVEVWWKKGKKFFTSMAKNLSFRSLVRRTVKWDQRRHLTCENPPLEEFNPMEYNTASVSFQGSICVGNVRGLRTCCGRDRDAGHTVSNLPWHGIPGSTLLPPRPVSPGIP
ncbi:uncharacterized protein ACIBXB_004547 isoform 2-T2 [Morphnus guianensis]